MATTNIIRKNHPGLRYLLQYWSKYCPLDSEHIAWARHKLVYRPKLAKHEELYIQGEAKKYVYLVAEGLLGRVHTNPETGRRKIWSIATPGSALMTTAHPYTYTPSEGDIISLRNKTLVIAIPYPAIRNHKRQYPEIDTLIDILGNKKRTFLQTLSKVVVGNDPFDRYLEFCDRMPELTTVLTQQEQSELLGIGRSTVQDAQYFLATGKRRPPREKKARNNRK